MDDIYAINDTKSHPLPVLTVHGRGLVALIRYINES